MNTSDKVALVTGGARRIGAEIVRQLHAAQYRVVIHCNGSALDAELLKEELNNARANSADVIVHDLAETGTLSNLIEFTIKSFGQLDCLVNNASVFFPTPLDALTESELDQVMGVNLTAPLLLSQSAARVMKSGCIISIIDIYAEKPLKGYLAYSISKAGLHMLTRGLAAELAPNIRVNGVSPGAILWPEDDAEMSEEEKHQLLAGLPLGKIGDPSDIAKAVVFLAEAEFITGQVLSVDGGQSVV